MFCRNMLTEETSLTEILPNIAAIDERIAAVRENLRELVGQAAAYSGAADENLMSQRIDEKAPAQSPLHSQPPPRSEDK